MMSEYVVRRTLSDELEHFGIKGQKWGVRRYENEDGTLTEAGKKRYAKSEKIASGEKISKEQMAKNVLKRAATGALVGSSAAQLADRIAKRKAFDDSTSTGIKLMSVNDTLKSDDFFEDFTFEDLHEKKAIGSRETGFHTNIWGQKIKDYKYFRSDTKFKSAGKAFHFYEQMTSNLLKAPAFGALAGAGAGALGSLAVDKLHNARIDRAKKFIEQHRDAYNRTNG